jgi:hypothetical protein
MAEVYKMDIQNQTEQKKSEETAGEVEETGTATVTEEEVVAEKKEGLSVEDIVSRQSLSDVEKSKQGTPKWLQDRIDEITAKKKQAEDRVKELEDKAKQIPVNRPIPPNRDEYDAETDYQKSLMEWKDRDDDWKENQRAEKKRKEEFENRLNSDIQKFVVRSANMKTKYSDFQERIDGTFYSALLKPVIIGSELGPEIGYYLTHHPDELQQLNSMDSIQAARAIGKLEERFNNVQKKATSVPPPINPVKGGLNTEIKDLSKIKNDDEWYKEWKAEKTRKLQAK